MGIESTLTGPVEERQANARDIVYTGHGENNNYTSSRQWAGRSLKVIPFRANKYPVNEKKNYAIYFSVHIYKYIIIVGFDLARIHPQFFVSKIVEIRGYSRSG